MEIFYKGRPQGFFPSNKFKAQLDADDNPIIARNNDGSPIEASIGKNLAKLKFDRSIHLPLVFDTEFTTSTNEPLQQSPRQHISSQIRHIDEKKGHLFFHPRFEKELNQAREEAGLSPVGKLKFEFDAFDWMEEQGFQIQTRTPVGSEAETLPILFVSIYAHFALAELNLIFRGDLKKQIKQLQRKGKITQQRRLQAVGKSNFQDSCDIDYIVKITHQSAELRKFNGEYRLAIRFIDTAGLHGAASYAEIAKNVGHHLEYKDTLSKADKENMLEVAKSRPMEFENYALGDLEVFEILKKYDSLMREIYKEMGIEKYYREPQPTIGGTIKQLFEARLAQSIGIIPIKKNPWEARFKAFADEFLTPVSPQALTEAVSATKALLAKVQGGRCRNAKSKIISIIDELICDIDISGCYGEGQRNQMYPIGTPEIWSYNSTSKQNHFPSLKEWLKWYGVKISKNGVSDWGELINGAWFARVSTQKPLKHPQDLVESWTTPTGEYRVDLLSRFIRKMGSDTENQSSDEVTFDVEYGCLKMFHHEILNGIITHDILQVILLAAPKQRNELLRELKVTTSMVYPASQKIETFTELETIKKEWKPKNVIIRKKDTRNRPYLLYKEQECFAWYGIDMGNLIIDNLLINRKKAKLLDGDKSPKDLLFKLAVNTTYGDMVSKFFKISNPCVGNNITARARALAWCMERGFNSFQSITDGGAFKLNAISKKPSFHPLAKPQLMPLGGEGEISAQWVDGKVSIEKNGKIIDLNWISRTAWEHLSNCFGSLDLFNKKTTRIKVTKETVTFEPRQGMFEFEVKDIFNKGIFHGSANYFLSNPNTQCLKARGYESKRKHTGWDLEEGNLEENDRYCNESPIRDFFNSLEKDADHVARQKTSVKQGILKVADYAAHAAKYDAMGLEPGDNISKPFLFSELSLSQFTFKSWEQWHSWSKSCNRCKQKYGQSLECFFLNPDGTLNYRDMIEWIDDAIQRKVLNPFTELDVNMHRQRDLEVEHPEKKTLKAVREKLELPFIQSEENAENWENWLKESTCPEFDYGTRKNKLPRTPSGEIDLSKLKRKSFKGVSLAPSMQNYSPRENDGTFAIGEIDFSKMKRKSFKGVSLATSMEECSPSGSDGTFAIGEIDFSKMKRKKFSLGA